MDLNAMKMQAQQQGIQGIQDKISSFADSAKTAIKEILIRKIALEALGINVLDTGAAKIVVLKKLDSSGAIDASSVYYVPVRKFIFDKTRELKNEFKKMFSIRDKILKVQDGDKKGSIANLALDAEELKGDERIGGHYTLKVDKAEGNLEKAILGKIVLRDANGKEILDQNGDKQFVEYSNQTMLHFLNDILQAGANFHLSDFAYGDIKPENFLVFRPADGQLHIKLADFGKAEEVGPDGNKLYKGNLRFAPPEGVLSQRGDIFGFGLVMIRMIEQKFTDANGQPLVNVSEADREPIAADPDKRFGVERMIIDHKSFAGMDEPSLSAKLFRRLPRAATLSSMSSEYKENQRKILHNYVDQLKNQWEKANIDADPKLTNEQISGVCQLIKKMLDDNPAHRPSMAEAAKEYSELMSPQLAAAR